MKTNLSILCRINGDDKIIFFNKEWLHFAVLNYGCNFTENNILYRSLWYFFCNITTEHLYRRMLNRVRAGHDARFDFRSDSAEYLRLFEMNITLQKRNEVLYEIRIIDEKPRLPQSHFEDETNQPDKMLIICSWCDRINTGEDNWQEVEKAVNTTKLFELQSLPQLSHGMCGDCYKTAANRISG